MDNSSLLQELSNQNVIRVHCRNIFQEEPAAKTDVFDFKKVEGMLLGVAIGDSLGITSEGAVPARRHEWHGEIRDYIPNKYVREARGFPSDDTQLSFWTLEQLIEDSGLIPENLAAKFTSSGTIYGLGGTVRQFLRNCTERKAWQECGPESAGNGALMRIAPILIPHLKTGGKGIWADAALATMVTHNDRAAISSSVAYVAMLWELLDHSEPPAPEWYLNRYVEMARDLEDETNYQPRDGQFKDFAGPLWRFVEEKLAWAWERNLSALDACNAWYSGAFLMETVPSVLYILMKHAQDPEEAIVRAVNDTKDNDTIASIVGAAVGALHGRDALPARWIDNLSGRTKSTEDDGRIFELIDQARKVFWKP